MVVLRRILLLCSVFGFQNLVNGDCASGWLRHDEYCYYFSHDRITWFEALTFCQGLHSTLAEITTSRIDTFFETIAKQFGYTFWVGGSDLLAEGNWIWLSTQQNFTYTDWIKGEPNGHKGENCLMINWNGHWNDGSCITKRPFICHSLASRSGNIFG